MALKRLATKQSLAFVASKNLLTTATESKALGVFQLGSDKEKEVLRLNRDPLTILPDNLSAEARKLHKSLFSQGESRWFRRPLRLFMFEVMLRAQVLSGQPKHFGWRLVTVPSGHWRVPWAYFVLFAFTFDCWLCTSTIAFCHTGFRYSAYHVFITLIHVIDMLQRCVSAYPTAGGKLELHLRSIVERYVKSWLLIDILGVLPLGVLIGKEWQWVRDCSDDDHADFDLTVDLPSHPTGPPRPVVCPLANSRRLPICLWQLGIRQRDDDV